MRVGYVVPMSVAAVNGGVRTQASFTVQHIKEFGVEPVLLSPWTSLQDEDLDIVHVFGSSVENSEIIPKVKELGIPVALSTIFYSNHSAAKIRAILRMEQFLSKFGRGIRSDFGIKSFLCHHADILLPNTSEESQLVSNGFGVSENKIEIIPNGVENRFSEADPALFLEQYGLNNFVLFVGQAAASRKNVRLLLQAAPNLEVPVVIIGDFGNNAYGKECKALAQNAQNVTLIPTLAHDDELLASAYAASKVFVLPSQYETPGIAALEAALAGSHIVITRHGGTKDYFEDDAEYVDPKSVSSLTHAIKTSLAKPETSRLKERILANFTWQKVAEKTAKQYQRLLS